MEQNTIQLDSSEQERIVFNAFFQHLNPPKAEATGSNPVGCASFFKHLAMLPISWLRCISGEIVRNTVSQANIGQGESCEAD